MKSFLKTTSYSRLLWTNLKNGGQRRGKASMVAAKLEQHLADYDVMSDMPPCDFKPKKYQGPSFDEIVRMRSSHIPPSLLTYYKKPLLVHQGHMQYVWDHTGRRYLDLIGGMITISVGHCHPRVVETLKSQGESMWHTSSIWMNPSVHQYAEQLTATLPGNLNVVHFVNSGSEANDLAIFMARLHTGNYDIVSIRNGYHGCSPQVMPLTAMNTWRYKVPMAAGFHATMTPDVFRGPWGGANCRDSPVQTERQCSCGPGQCMAGELYAEQLEDLLLTCTPKDGIAAFVTEAIQGGGGTIQFPHNFLSKAEQAVKSRGGLLIVDEVQAGFGRTGEHFWGFESHGIQPDIVTVAKGIGNGFPIAAVITTPEVSASMGRALHFNTFSGNPLATSVASTVLDVMKEDGCQENCHVVGTYFLQELGKLRDEFEIIGDVRGKGLMIGVEMVTDKVTKTPLPKDEWSSIWEATKDMGILIGKAGLHQNVYRFKPPMCITHEDVDFAVAVFRKAVQQHMEQKNKQ